MSKSGLFKKELVNGTVFVNWLPLNKDIMKKFFLMLMITGSVLSVKAQNDSSAGTAVVIKDTRIDVLGRKMAEYNEGLAMNVRTGKGYRLMVISTNDRDKAMQVRSQLYQLFPDQKQYMTYQIPNIKIKFGNFLDKDSAEKAKKQILAQKLVTGNIYVLAETIEIKPEKKDPNAPATDN